MKMFFQTVLVALLFSAVVSGCSSNSSQQSEGNNISDSVTFGICTDVHYNVIHDAQRRISIFVDDMNKRGADFIIEMGDFCYPDSTSDEFLAVFNSFKGDKYFVLGNHDKDNGVTWEQSVKYFGMPAPYYSFDKKGVHFVVMNGNERSDTAPEGYPRYVSNKQLSWLSEDLDKTDNPVVVFIHQSLFDSHGVINRDTVRSILESNKLSDGSNKVKVCFNGHSHIDAARQIDGIWYVTINSMSYHWVGEKCRHETYSDSIHEKYPWIEYVCPYKDPLYAFVTVYSTGKVVIDGVKSEWDGPSPDSLGYKSEYYLKEWVVPKVSSRELE